MSIVERCAPPGDCLVKPEHLRDLYRVPGFVYVIQWGDDGPVKIGQAINPISRMAELQVANWMALRLAAAVPVIGPLTPIEKSAHRLAIVHLLSGEWFDLEPIEAVEFILAAADLCDRTVYPFEETVRLLKENERIKIRAQWDAEKIERRRRNGWSD